MERLYATHGEFNYGEGVTQIEHALQSAVLAEMDSAPHSLIAACLLHDVGHLFEKEEDVTRFDIDHRHEMVAPGFCPACLMMRFAGPSPFMWRPSAISASWMPLISEP